MASYTKDKLLSIYEKRGINIDHTTLKKKLVKGFSEYDKLVRALLATIFGSTCGGVSTIETALPREGEIKAKIKNMFGQSALDRLEYCLSFLIKEVEDYTLMMELMKYYRKEIPMPVRECTQAKMAQHMINAMTKFESKLHLHPYPRVVAISSFKHACGPISKDPVVIASEKRNLKQWMKSYKYYPSIEKYIQ